MNQQQDVVPYAQMGNDDLLLLEEVAQLSRVPLNTLRSLRQRGLGPKTFKLIGRVVARRSDVLAWIAEQESLAGGSR